MFKEEVKAIIKPNPNKKSYEEISKVIEDNDGYCCCAIKRNEDTKCICTAFKESIDSGFCHCGRFYKVRQFPSLAIIGSPEDYEKIIRIAETFQVSGSILHYPQYKSLQQYVENFKYYDELIMSMIHASDSVIFLNESEKATEFLKSYIYWAKELGKKIYFSKGEVESDEN